jgi:2-methylisocitrate lyase-like PEP mutase family enzyme
MNTDPRKLRKKLDTGQFFVVPGVHDMIAAVIADRVGFDVVYGSGYWLTASALGLPDAGIATYTEMRDRIATLVRTTNAAVMADGDTGYGGLLNVHHTVRGYEEAGAQAIQLEDQEFPKKCGHTPYKRLVSMGEMADKITVACEARKSADGILIIGRTDARQSEGLEGTIRRLEAYDKAGADILFPEALTSEEEMRQVCAHFDKPVMANMANGGLTPIPSADVLRDIGYRLAIYPSLTALTAASAIEVALTKLRDEGLGDSQDGSIFDFKTFCELIGFKDVWAFEERWKGAA